MIREPRRVVTVVTAAAVLGGCLLDEHGLHVVDEVRETGVEVGLRRTRGGEVALMIPACSASRIMGVLLFKGRDALMPASESVSRIIWGILTTAPRSDRVREVTIGVVPEGYEAGDEPMGSFEFGEVFTAVVTARGPLENTDPHAVVGKWVITMKGGTEEVTFVPRELPLDGVLVGDRVVSRSTFDEMCDRDREVRSQ